MQFVISLRDFQQQDTILKNAMFKQEQFFNAHLFSLLKPKN